MNHVCTVWQGMIQMIVYYAARGYHHHYRVDYPEKKRERWQEIDEKMSRLYKAGKTKYQRVYQRKKGVARIAFLRWESHCIIMYTEGALPDGIDASCFRNIRTEPVRIRISGQVTIEVRIQPQSKKVEARLSRDTYVQIKEDLGEDCKLADKGQIISAFCRLNGFPAWSGIIAQKLKLAEYMIKQAKRHGVTLRPDDLTINTRRKVYKVWQSRH